MRQLLLDILHQSVSIPIYIQTELDKTIFHLIIDN